MNQPTTQQVPPYGPRLGPTDPVYNKPHQRARECPVCGRWCASRAGYLTHVKAAHGRAEEERALLDLWMSRCLGWEP
jgi:hypothetical protein